MSMLPIQRTTLNTFGDSQPAFKTFAQLDGKPEDDIRLGDLIAGNGLDDVYANRIYTITANVPAPAGSVVTKWLPMFKAPASGFVTKAELYIYDDTVTWTAGTTTAKNYFVALSTYYTLGASIPNSGGADLLTGVTNNTNIELPLNREIPALMTVGGSYAIVATGASIVITAATSFANLPAIGDLLCISPTAAHTTGASKVNVGVYRVTAFTTTTVTATKINATNPASVTSFTAGALEVSISRQNPGYSVIAGDQVGVAVIVPVTGGVDLSKVAFTFNLTLKLNPV